MSSFRISALLGLVVFGVSCASGCGGSNNSGGADMAGSGAEPATGGHDGSGGDTAGGSGKGGGSGHGGAGASASSNSGGSVSSGGDSGSGSSGSSAGSNGNGGSAGSGGNGGDLPPGGTGPGGGSSSGGEGGSTTVCDYPEGLTLRTQADVAALAAENCGVINGSLSVVGNEIVTLDGLESIQKITERLTISGPSQLNDVSGLSGMVEVGQALGMTETSALVEVEFPALRVVGGQFIFNSHEKVELVRLPNLTRAADVKFYGNEALEEIEMNKLAETGNLSIDSNTSLMTFHQFSSLSSVDEIYIANNPLLARCEVDDLDARLDACVVCESEGPPGNCN